MDVGAKAIRLELDRLSLWRLFYFGTLIKNGLKINISGTKYWYLNNQLHRVNDPAVEFANGTKFWFFNGRLHRVDGPAIEYASGHKHWYLNGQEYTDLKLFQQMVKLKGFW
jgi:hypothetical protein